MTTPSVPSYVKLIRKDRTHNGLLFQEGLNCLKETETFDERRECGPGGLYFCKEEDFGYWICMYKEDLGYVATVTLCPDSNCVAMDSQHKLKADRFLLGPFQPIEKFWTSERAKHVVQQDGGALQFVPVEHQTAELCLEAVQQNGYALQVVPLEHRTTDICLSAVQNNGYAIQFVPVEHRTATLCVAAVQQNGCALRFIPMELKTATLCSTAVQQTKNALQYVPEEFKSVLMDASVV